MRIRLPFAGIFFVLLVIAGYAGLTSLQLNGVVNDKVLHIVTFFLLTVVFYWIVDTSRRRTINMALLVCTVGLGVGSEILQALIPNNGRQFDFMDIVANFIGSLSGLALCTWYHKRMLDRRRQRKYSAVPGGPDHEDDLDDSNDIRLDDHEEREAREDRDVELGLYGGHASAVTQASPEADHVADDTTETDAAATPATSASVASGSPPGLATTTLAPAKKTPATSSKKSTSMEDELDNWDENADDDDDDDNWGGPAGGDLGSGSMPSGPAKSKKHVD